MKITEIFSIFWLILSACFPKVKFSEQWAMENHWADFNWESLAIFLRKSCNFPFNRWIKMNPDIKILYCKVCKYLREPLCLIWISSPVPHQTLLWTLICSVSTPPYCELPCTIFFTTGSTPVLSHFLEAHCVFSMALLEIHWHISHLYKISQIFGFKVDNETNFDQPTSHTYRATVLLC